jgi:aminopeptidase-like protein
MNFLLFFYSFQNTISILELQITYISLKVTETPTPTSTGVFHLICNQNTSKQKIAFRVIKFILNWGT